MSGDIYMIFNANGGDIPRVRHEGFEKALAEAKRLAEKQPRHNFYILKVAASVRISDDPYEIKVY